MIGAHPLLEMRARSWRRALSTWRRYSASTTGAAILPPPPRSPGDRRPGEAEARRRAGEDKTAGVGSSGMELTRPAEEDNASERIRLALNELAAPTNPLHGVGGLLRLRVGPAT